MKFSTLLSLRLSKIYPSLCSRHQRISGQKIYLTEIKESSILSNIFEILNYSENIFINSQILAAKPFLKLVFSNLDPFQALIPSLLSVKTKL